MISKIDISEIIEKHLKSFKKIGKQQGTDYWAYVLFFGVPFVSAFLLVFWLKLDLKKHVSDLLIVVSIIGGFSFNLLALIYSVLDKVREKYPEDAVKQYYAKSVHANISFTILVAMCSTFFLLVYDFDYPCTGSFMIAQEAMSFIIYFMLGMFFLTLLMVLKRIFIIMSNNE